jgi:hypothetical protein
MRPWLRELVGTAAAEIGMELRQMSAHGAHEASAALFTGSAFVMYPRGTRDDPQIGIIEHEARPQIEREM